MSLELRNVTKRYPGGAVGAAGVSVTIDPGQLVAFFGPSGSGKTSLLHIAGVLQPPDDGEVFLDGERVDTLEEDAAAVLRRTKLGFVFQTAGLLALLSAEENVDVSLRLIGVGGREGREKVGAALAAVGMEGRLGHRPDELSGGEQQRVAIARALVHGPGYILADEPTGELDTGTGAAVLDLLEGISRNGTAVLIATHDPAALELADRAYFVRDGALHEPDRGELSMWLTEGTTFTP